MPFLWLGLAMLGSGPTALSVDPVPALREARAKWDEGAREPALAALQRIEEASLADHVALLRARLLSQGGDTGGALEALSMGLQLDPPSELRAGILQAAAAIHLERGELVAAYRSQQGAWESTRDPIHAAELAIELARAFEVRRLPGDALGLYRRTWQEWPVSEPGAEAYARSVELQAATGAAPLPPEAHLRRADRLRGAYRCEAALPIYRAVLATDGMAATTPARARRGLADCLFQRRRYPEAVEAYERIARDEPESLDPAIRVARSHARAGDLDPAIEILDRLSRRASEVELARIRYLMAILWRADEPRKAARLLRAVERQRAAPGHARLARWRLAWQDLQEGRTREAARRLRPFTRGSRWDIEVQRARYWRAVAQLDFDPELGEISLRTLVEQVPLSYYGLIAAQRLGIRPTLERSFVGERGDPQTFPREVRARWLLQGGFPEQARIEVESWIHEPGFDRMQRLAAAPLLHELGSHFRAVRILIDGFGGAFEQGIDPAWREAWLHAWPRVYSLSVQRAVHEFDFDEALVYAIMREESTYRETVSSPVGALGLMQIIPPTADRIARELGMTAFDPENLLEAGLNIRFGTYYLNHLMGLFDNSMPLAIASYNAGPEVVTSWLERDGQRPADAFVDSVPYAETRRYLRRVLRSYRVYRLLYAEDPQPPLESGAQSPAAADR